MTDIFDIGKKTALPESWVPGRYAHAFHKLKVLEQLNALLQVERPERRARRDLRRAVGTGPGRD